MIWNWTELLTGAPTWLRHVYRYTGSRTHEPETVAEHCFYTGFYAMCLGQQVEYQTGLTVNWKWLMTSTMIHDMEEGISGDFPRPFKYLEEGLKKSLDAAGAKAMGCVAERVLHGPPLESLSKHVQHERRLVEWWRHSKNLELHPLEAAILDLADYLSVLTYVWQERHNGNQSILMHVTGIWNRLDLYKQNPAFSKFSFLWEPMQRITEEIRSGDTTPPAECNPGRTGAALRSEPEE